MNVPRSAGNLFAHGKAACAFSTQYLSVVLIVLSFTIGAFLRGPAKLPEPVAVAPQPLAAAMDADYTDLFEADSAELNEEKVRALAEVLQNHDLQAEISIYPVREAEKPMELAVARAVALSIYLERQKVPPEALRIFAEGASGRGQARVRLYRVRGLHG